MQNAHIAIRETWTLIGGNPIPYLDHLRGAMNAVVRRLARTEWPSGKFQFAAFVEQNGGRVPKSFALIVDGRVAAGALAAGEAAGSFLKALPAGQYFCKPNVASSGRGGFGLEISDTGALVDGEERSIESIEALFASRSYVVQASLTPLQHAEIARFNSRTVNTMRLVTFDAGTGPMAAAACLRMSVASAAVDNWSAGGVMVPIDLERGVLGEFGIFKKDRVAIATHPQSGHTFLDQKIPHLTEAAQMACMLHRRVNLASVGWDIALLEDGPCIVEANRGWEIRLSSQLNPGFTRTFLDFHLSPGADALRLELAGSFERRDALRNWLCVAMGRSRASARVDDLSDEHFAVTVGGSRTAVESAMESIRQSALVFGVNEIRTTPAEKPPLPGLNIDATFSP